MSGSTLFSPHQLNAGPILSAIDSIPATKGLGCYVSLNKQMRKLRAPRNAGSTVVIELRPPVGTDPSVPPRDPGTSPADEWNSLDFSCGSAAINWIGVILTAAAVPETAGTTAIGTAFLYGGAYAASAQCAISILRVSDLYDGNQGLNAAMDQNKGYIWGMYSLDLFGLGSGVYGALPGGAALNGASKLLLLNRISAGVGVANSAAVRGGVIHDSVVWIVSKSK
jgi:hypothetical protein